MKTRQDLFLLQRYFTKDHALQVCPEYTERYLRIYANSLVANKLVAALIAEAVMAAPTEKTTRALAPAEKLISLQTNTLGLCRQWLDAKAVIFHLRKPKNPT